tara:strand:+ start:987 stop:1838 length:852 start_codon:yes stop_codon:yes gene_type:complete
MDKFLLFTTGGGSADPLNWSNDEAALYPVSQFKGMRPASGRTIDMFFETSFGKEVVTLGIKNMTHIQVMKSITQAINSSQSVVTVADVDNAVYCSPFIQTVLIASQETFLQKITANTKTKLNIARSNYSSCLISNVDGSDDVTCTLYLTSQVGSDITDTGTNANEADNPVGTASVTLTVDGTAATSDVFANERVYKSDGTLFGICTARNSNTEIVFGGGLEQILANNADLYTGTRYTIFDQINIPAKSTLKLEQDEISFDNAKFDLYAKSGDANGQLVFTFIY